MKQWVKLSGINTLVFIILLIPIECYYGSWFKPSRINELNIVSDYTTEMEVSHLYPYPKSIITYTRDRYGLRGTAFNQPQKITLLTVGGSTTDQRYIDDICTWQILLEQALRKDGCTISTGNAGMDGHSTFAHLASFDSWFANIPGLKPKWVLYYIGINDFYIDAEHERDRIASHSWISRSALYQLARKIKHSLDAHRLGATHQKIDFNQLPFYSEGLLDTAAYRALAGTRIKAYTQRLEHLIAKTRAWGAEPIFVTQPTYFYRFKNGDQPEGISSHKLKYGTAINGVDYYYIKRLMDKACCEVATGLNVPCIDIGADKHWNESDFYDYVHLTFSGTHKLAAELKAPLQQIVCKSAYNKNAHPVSH